MTDAVLVDTHILVWARIEPEKLTAGERKTLDAAPRRYVSAATLWEIAILIGLGRLGRNAKLLEVPEGFALLPILPEHLAMLLELPFRHRDPFDRILIAQAQSEGLSLLTRDATMARYETRRR
jgi:PIN domain nuclease of toxin-antitoxin system